MVSLAPHRRPLLLLWGFMGTGKSSVAKLLAATLARPVLDLDALIVAREGCSIPVLFDTRGEAGFRAAERAAMTEVLAREDVCVVALGGGTLVDPDLRQRALSQAFVVGLAASPDTIAQRTAGSDRPLLAATDEAARVERIAALLMERAGAYAEAHATVSAEPPVDEVARCVAALWNPAAAAGEGLSK